MKNIIVLIICLLYIELVWAQKPEPILSFATYVKESAYYKQQASLWKKETQANPQNAFAWFNYYRATRNLVRTDTSDRRSQEEKYQQQADIVNEMEKVVPNTYEFNLAKWMHHGQNFAYLKHLKKADELGSGRTEHLSDMAGWGEIERNKEKKDKYCKLWLENGLVSPGLMYYNYNTLIGLKPNAILLTFGDNDTYPAWLLQAKGIRTDVTIINAYLFLIDDYRNKLLKELGVAHKPFAALDTVDIENDYWWFRKEMVKTLATNSKNYPVYLVVSCDNEYKKWIESDLYLIGLAYEYSNKPVDNLAFLKMNFENKFALDYLDKSFYKDISKEIVARTNLNYIIPMIKLYDHYKLAGAHEKANKIKEKLLLIGAGHAEEKDLKKYLNQDNAGGKE
jgi:hypothetical protein